MLIRDPINGRLFEVANPLWEQLSRGQQTQGDRWLSLTLDIHYERGNARLLETPEGWQYDPARSAALDGGRVVKKRKEEKVGEPLKLPVVPEVDEEGHKRLYKTRYALLEKKYVTLYNQNKRYESRIEDMEEGAEQDHQNILKLDRELAQLRLLTADSALIEKRMTQIARELKIEVGLNPYTSLGDKLEAFLGALLTRVRNIEEEADELAD